MDQGISRREFLKKTAAGAAGVAAVSALGGCSTVAAAGSNAADMAASLVKGEGGSALSGGAFLNPQDYDYTKNSITDWSKTKLFSPWKLGPFTLNHRMVKSAAGSDTWTKGMGKEMYEYYANFARGGIEMVWVENYSNLLTKYPRPGRPDFNSYPNQELIKAVKSAGAHIGYQVDTMGSTIKSSDPNFARTRANEFVQPTCSDITKDDIKSLQEGFIEGAKKLQDAGFDAFEINAAGNNFPQSFLSRLRNKRTDEYGPQSFENRTRFLTEIIEGIKKANGKDFILQLLINGIEENDERLGDSSYCTTVEENCQFAKMFEQAGVDSLHLRLGPNGMHIAQFASDLYFTGRGIEGTTGYGNQFDFKRHWQGKLIANHSGCGMMLDVAAEVKKAVKIPVGTVTYMDPAHAPDFFEKALQDGKVDFFIMTRPLTVDTNYVNKLKAGKIDEIAPCTRCMHCHFDSNREYKTWEHCRVNACTQRAYRAAMPEGDTPNPASDKNKKVMVVGGGPAGMEAARIAAERGYKVSLYEKNAAPGGLIDFANAVKGPHENLLAWKAYLIRQQALKGVEVHVKQNVDAAFIKAQKPDIVILATGGKRPAPTLKGTGSTAVIPVENFLGAKTGDNVTVIGSGCQALDVAEYLNAQGKHVTMVFGDEERRLGDGHSSWAKAFELPMLKARGTRIWPQAKVVNVGNGTVTIRGAVGTDITIPCDTVIEALDMLPDDSLKNELQGAGMDVYTVGDCADPWNFANAVATANLTARKI